MLKKIKQLLCGLCGHKYKKAKCVKDYEHCQDYITFADVGMWYRLEQTCKKCGKVKVSYAKDKKY